MESLSVVVPIYNKEKYLEKSLTSLLENEDQDTEFILIDDGSKDSSFDIATTFSKKDSRIRLMKNPCNSGVSYTRNKGISEAKGEYIGFFDADDTVDKGFYQALRNKAVAKGKKPDIVAGQFCNVIVKYGEIEKEDGTETILKTSIPFSTQREEFVSGEVVSCCNKIYHHNFLEGKYFLDCIHEDTYFHLWTINEARRVLENRKVRYYYHPEVYGRNYSYYGNINSNFYELIKAEDWLYENMKLHRCIKEELDILQSYHFCKLLIDMCSWEIGSKEKKELIGSVASYCLKHYKEFDFRFVNMEVINLQAEYEQENKTINQNELKEKIKSLATRYHK